MDCGGDATIVDGGIPVISFWGQTKAFYWSKLEETNMCDFVSMSLNNDEGEQLACCNVVLKHGKECESDEDEPRKLAAQDKLSFGQN